MRLFALLLSLPWWSYLAVAAAILWLGNEAQVQRDAYAAKVEVALAGPAPAVVDLSPAVLHTPGEVNEVALRMQVATDETTELIERANGVTTSRRYMYVFVPPYAEALPDRLRTFAVINPLYDEAFIDLMMANTVGFGTVGPIVELSGVLEDYSSSASHIDQALEERGLDRALNEIYLEPFLNGREAGLAALHRQAAGQERGFWMVAAFVAAFGLLKFAITRAGRRRTAAPVAPPMGSAGITAPDAPAAPNAPAPQMPRMSEEEMAALSPLQRIRLREAGQTQVLASQPETTKTGFLGHGSGKSDHVTQSPIRRRKGRKADPFDKLAQEAARR